MQILETSGGVLLKEANDVAFFNPRTMQLFGIEADSSMKLDEIQKSLPSDFTSKPETGYNEISDGYNLHRREAILPVMLGAETLERFGIRPNLGRFTINIAN